MKHPEREAGQRGAALLVVIALIAIMAAIATAYLAASSVQSKVAGALAEEIRAEAAASGAVNLVIWALETNGAEPGEGALTCMLGEYEMIVRVENEAAKLNVNFAPERELARAIGAAGFGAQEADQIAARIKDYLAEDRSADAADTANGEAPRPHAAFEIFGELALVEGLGESELRKLGSVLSVYSRNASANALLAGEAPPGARMVKIRAAARRGERIRFVRRAVVEFDDLSGEGPAIREWGRAFPADIGAQSAARVSERGCAEVLADASGAS